MRTKKRVLTLLITSLIIGCTSNKESDQLIMLADYRSSVISSVLPMKMQNLTLVQAKADLNAITLVFINDETKSTSDFLKKITRQYCQDIELRNLLEQGLIYKLVLLNEKQQKKNETIISLQSCINN